MFRAGFLVFFVGKENSSRVSPARSCARARHDFQDESLVSFVVLKPSFGKIGALSCDC
jgi:hypothetical protein